jgi:hypothetical protein
MVHNEFAADMVRHFKIPASPEMDFRITKGGNQSTDYDSFDGEDTYYEFKTRHSYLPYEGLTKDPRRDRVGFIRWMRFAGIYAQAMDQRMSLVNCGVEGKLVWVFDSKDVADAVRENLGGWLIDSVLSVHWKRPK